MPHPRPRTTICGPSERSRTPPKWIRVLRHARQTTLGKRPAVVRSILTTALLLCVMSGALPAEAVLNPHNSMPCCRGMKGSAGECHGNSCPMHLRARAKPSARVQNDPVCGAGHVLPAAGETPLSSQATSGHRHVGNLAQRDNRQESAGAASLAKPCPSECCGGVAASFTGQRRQRHAAALTHNQRPRPPDSELQAYVTCGITKAASALRRLHPPRAPPNSLDLRTA